MQPTALVNEAYLRLVDAAAGALAEPRALFGRGGAGDAAHPGRSRPRQRLPEARRRAPLGDARRSAGGAGDRPPIWWRWTTRSSALAAVDARKAQVVELRFFGGLSVEETAEVLEVSPETVMRDWKFAKVWLLRELSPDGGA